jgi:hypothetical protein
MTLATSIVALKLWAVTVCVVGVVAVLVLFALTRLGKVADNGAQS